MNPNLTSELVLEYRGSPFAKIWRTLWRLFPKFSNKHSPFFFFADGAVLWNQGFGSIAFLKGNRSVMIRWTFDELRRGIRTIHLSAVRHWDSPHENETLDERSLSELRERLSKRFQMRGEGIIFR
jgi:hypothetical protein